MRRPRKRGLSASLAFVLTSLGIVLLGAVPAQAARLCFGTQEYLRTIQNVGIKGQNGEALALGYKNSFYFFLMPYSMSDDGYIFRVRTISRRGSHRCRPAGCWSPQAIVDKFSPHYRVGVA